MEGRVERKNKERQLEGQTETLKDKQTETRKIINIIKERQTDGKKDRQKEGLTHRKMTDRQTEIKGD